MPTDNLPCTFKNKITIVNGRHATFTLRKIYFYFNATHVYPHLSIKIINFCLMAWTIHFKI